MERKKSQLLFNFLPADTFDHADNGVIGRVTSIDPADDDDADELPKHYVLNRIRPRAAEWDRSPEYRASDVQFVVPDGVQFEIFPRDFECSRCRCVTQITDEDLRRDDYRPKCDGCGKWFRDTEQLQLVAICKCGKLESLTVPSHCSDKGAKLMRRGSSLADATWMCECGTILDSPYDVHGRCSTCGTLEITVHSASRTFYPHRREFVNIRSDDIDQIRGSQHYRLDIIADHLADTVTDTMGKETELDALTREALDQLDPEVQEQVEAAREETAQAEEARLEQKKEILRTTFEEAQLRGVAEEVFEFESVLTEGVYSQTLDDLAREARSRRDLEAPTIQRYADRAKDLNIADVRLIENFPITTAVYGYSRVTPEPEDDVQLRPLRSDDRDRQLDEIYILTSEAEALMVTLDAEAVVEWLEKNIDHFDAPRENVRDWVIETMTPASDESVYPYFAEINRGQPERYMLVLLHTLSHLVLNTVDALSGYAGDSLVEYTLPRTLSFVVYKRSQTDFSLGSMFTMVENRFDQICDYLEDDARVCLYDPLCEREENSACEGCLYLSTRSCSHGNHNLARSTVYGGEFDDGAINVGFFDV